MVPNQAPVSQSQNFASSSNNGMVPMGGNMMPMNPMGGNPMMNGMGGMGGMGMQGNGMMGMGGMGGNKQMQPQGAGPGPGE